jgi:hypothetical protein
MAVQDLTSLENVKAWLPINSTTTSDDTTIARMITATSMDFMRATKRPDLLLNDYTEARRGDGANRMIAYHWPIVSVMTLTVGASEIPESVDKIAPGWYIDSDIDSERIWNIYLNSYCFTDGAPVGLVYSAGYVQPGGVASAGQIMLPGDIEQAVIDWCAYRYKERPNVSATQRRSVQGESSQTELLDAPPNVLKVIERYTRIIPSLDRRQDERDAHVKSNYRFAAASDRK